MAKDGKKHWVKVATLAPIIGIGVKWLQNLVKELPKGVVRRSHQPGVPTWIDAPGFVQWWVDREMQKRRRRETVPAASSSGNNGDPLLVADAPASPALERYREARADLAALELAERQRDLLPRQTVHEVFGRIASRLRDAGEQLGREHGSEAHEVLTEALDDSEREIGSL
jgi:hypothetical protein